MRIGYLVSGKLGLIALQTCYNCFGSVFIGTDNKSESIITFAKERRILLFIGNPRNGRLREFVKELKIDVLLSVNYLFLIEKDIIKLSNFPINFHGSLLPKYRGRTPHVWAIINNEVQTGVTAHIIDGAADTGDVILQKVIKINSNETGADILIKYESIYPDMILEVLDQIKENKISTYSQDNKKATYFGKRTPEDGEINWDWHKERIKNWVRAQAYPYPGAFSIFEGEKIVIDKIIFSDLGFSQDVPNGMILSDNPAVIVKTPNGAVKLEIIRTHNNVLRKGKRFGK